MLCFATQSLGNFDDDDDIFIEYRDMNLIIDDESDSDIYNMEFVQHKKDYYMNKLEYENVDEYVLYMYTILYRMWD